MPKIKTRRLINHKYEDVIEETVYCRKCMGQKKKKDFYSALDLNLDKNGLLSVCKECVNGLYESALMATNNSMDESIYKVCKMLNILYSTKVVASLKLHLETMEEKGGTEGVFGLYKSHLGRHLTFNEGLQGTFEDSLVLFDKEANQDALVDEELEDQKYLNQFWGEGLKKEDYQFLENELANWKHSHSSDTYAEIVLLREICYVQLDLKNSRIENKDTSASLKKLLDAMKASALDPAKASQASGGNGKETWGIFIKNIEETTPAEYYKDKTLFKDFDGLDVYFQNYIRRPAINFFSSTSNLELLDAPENTDETEDSKSNPMEEDIAEEGE